MVIKMANSIEKIQEYILIHYRWIFVCLFLLPLSVVFNIWFYARNRIVFYFQSAPKKHEHRIRSVQKQIKEWHLLGKKVPMCTGRPGWLTMSFRQPVYKNTMHKVNVNLVDILEVNTDEKTIHVEPMVTMGQISATLIPLGWTLPILPELDDLTVGGLIMGTGIETSSHIYGLFQHICISFEIAVADGSIIQCSKDENSDLFFAIPWSHGCLGFLCSAVLKIVPAKKYVRVHYKPFNTMAEFISSFDKEATRTDAADFVEGLVFSSNSGVVMTANMVDNAEDDKLNKIGLYYKPWFYKHIEKFLKIGSATEYIPLRDYYHRHSRSIFWELQYIIPFGNNIFFRLLFGWLVPPKVSLLKLTQGATVKKLYEKHQMIQDVLVPIKHLESSLHFINENVKVYPLWLCPFLLRSVPGFVHPLSNTDEMYVDIGVYGEPAVSKYDALQTTRNLEEFVRSINGFQMLYADTYMTKEEFRKMFDHTVYEAVRNQIEDCKHAFPDIYDKINRKARC